MSAATLVLNIGLGKFDSLGYSYSGTHHRIWNFLLGQQVKKLATDNTPLSQWMQNIYYISDPLFRSIIAFRSC